MTPSKVIARNTSVETYREWAESLQGLIQLLKESKWTDRKRYAAALRIIALDQEDEWCKALLTADTEAREVGITDETQVFRRAEVILLEQGRIPPSLLRFTECPKCACPTPHDETGCRACHTELGRELTRLSEKDDSCEYQIADRYLQWLQVFANYEGENGPATDTEHH